MKKCVLMTCAILFDTLLFAQLPGPIYLPSADGNFAQYLSKSQLKLTTDMADKSAAGITFNNIENTKGTRYLFDNWVKGDSLVGNDGSKLVAASYAFNFDKLSGSLLASADKKHVLAISPQLIQSFALADRNRQYSFEHLNTIDSTKFFLALVKDAEKYSLYKLFAEKYIPSSYHNDGLIETGNRDDEYKDESQYYILLPDKTFRLVVAKAKVLKDILMKERDKANQFINSHRDDEINENYLTGLINYVNQ